MTRRARWGLAAGVVLALGGAGGTWLWLSPADRSPEEPPPPPTPSPSPPAYALEVDLCRLKAITVSGRVGKRNLRQPAEEVRQTFTDLYTTAFVDPARWEGGAFPALFDHFAPEARREARRHLDDLTLGRAAGHLTAVRPEWARLDVRFLLAPSRSPVAAQASMRFSATGFASDGTEVPVRHRGEFVLERLEGHWLVVAYDVEGGFGSEAGP